MGANSLFFKIADAKARIAPVLNMPLNELEGTKTIILSRDLQFLLNNSTNV